MLPTAPRTRTSCRRLANGKSTACTGGCGACRRFQATDPPSANSERTELGRIWCELLSLDSVGVTEGFFDLGGHSLIATQLMARIRERFDVELPVRQVFETPTIERLALAIVEAGLLQRSGDEIADLLSQIEGKTYG